MGIRRRTIAGDLDPRDLDALLCAVFLEVVHEYSLRRQGSVAAGLLLDTRKAYLRTVTREQNDRKNEQALVVHARRFAHAEREPFQLADQQEPAPAVVDPDDREEMRQILLRCRIITPEDVELLLAVDIHGQTIPAYMKRRGLITGDETADARERDRLARRRLRARERLRHFFQKKLRR